MECSSKENISQEMIGRKTRKIRLGLFAYKRSLSTGNFIFVPRKTILLTYSFVWDHPVR
ncbi:hypothetical protein CHCC14435_1982 [Bacillus licheniformis]|nr:hypothetical protein CHCC14561_3936 [Bacillus licheniformis]TWN52040.1 hypothetical protein CHCC14435_1982 [Bacillus licheniformis]TWN59286.1 hypothetical protein CHCC14429_0686 [Bacillus licheniformis]TWN95691.1 hypothetical protein CHCC20489_1823 [Bacillus licheniformis]